MRPFSAMREVSSIPSSSIASPDRQPSVCLAGAASNVRQTKVVEKVSGRLLLAAVADSSERVRTAVLQALVGTVALDDYMAQVGGGRLGCDE